MGKQPLPPNAPDNPPIRDPRPDRNDPVFPTAPPWFQIREPNGDAFRGPEFNTWLDWECDMTTQHTDRKKPDDLQQWWRRPASCPGEKQGRSRQGVGQGVERLVSVVRSSRRISAHFDGTGRRS